MPITVDARTILLVHGLLLMSACPAFIIASRMMRQFGALSLWAISCAIQGLGLLLIAMRGHWDPLLSVVLANILLLAGSAMLPHAIALDLGVRLRRGVLAGVVCLGMALFVFAYYWHDTSLRIFISSGVIAFMLLWGGHIVWLYLQRSDALPMVWGILLPFVLLGTALAVAALRSLFQWVFMPPVIESYLGASFLQDFSPHSVVHLLCMLSTTCIYFSVIITIAMRLHRDLEHLAHHDPLTGLLNRYMFFDVASQMVALQARSQQSSVLLFLDLDYFKQVNDVHGHAAGDAVLRNFSDVLRDQLRLSDVVGRYGGEEFCVLLPNSSLSHGIQTADRLGAMTRAINMAWQDTTIAVTVSIGVAFSEHSEEGLESMIMRADAALYQAKRSGRNKVIVAPAEIAMPAPESAQAPVEKPMRLMPEGAFKVGRHFSSS
ncbi:GGDEF domain-containing protein [Uliginosibacterium gangwonense]|uniref:GGDEF domain-containing protein n=1 Tax=Uliginosibacterium gangwonense TaxID=392736 RepID=UPI00037456A5|nr:GGDEF domain-containing protein [Uliginosibacterium gangwonense]